MKGNKLIEKLDRAQVKYEELLALKRRSMALLNELGVSIGLNRELAKLDLKWADQEHFIRGAQVGAVDNYKHAGFPATMCKAFGCQLRHQYQPADRTQCLSCGTPLGLGWWDKEWFVETTRLVTPSELRTRFANHYVGAQLKNGRKVWFEELINPSPLKVSKP
jgi:hypothetical protein